MAAQKEDTRIIYEAIIATFDDLAARIHFIRRLVSALMSDGRNVLPAKVLLPFQMHQLSQMEKDLAEMKTDMETRIQALKGLEENEEKRAART